MTVRFPCLSVGTGTCPAVAAAGRLLPLPGRPRCGAVVRGAAASRAGYRGLAFKPAVEQAGSRRHVAAHRPKQRPGRARARSTAQAGFSAVRAA